MEHQLLWLPAVPSRRWGWDGGKGRGCLPADAMGVYSPPPAPLCPLELPTLSTSELRRCVKDEVAVLGFPS